MLNSAADSSQIKSTFLTLCWAVSYALVNPHGLLHIKLPSSAEKLLQCKCCQIRVYQMLQLHLCAICWKMVKWFIRWSCSFCLQSSPSLYLATYLMTHIHQRQRQLFSKPFLCCKCGWIQTEWFIDIPRKTGKKAPVAGWYLDVWSLSIFLGCAFFSKNKCTFLL